VRDMAALQDWIARVYEAGYVAVDTETTSLNEMQAELVGISLSVKTRKQAEEIISKAKVAMEQERERVLREAREEIAALVVLTTSKVLSKDLSAEEKERFTNRASEELNLVS
jgi:F0F1-type ATP synthase membrane subunit b/b'